MSLAHRVVLIRFLINKNPYEFHIIRCKQCWHLCPAFCKLYIAFSRQAKKLLANTLVKLSKHSAIITTRIIVRIR